MLVEGYWRSATLDVHLSNSETVLSVAIRIYMMCSHCPIRPVLRIPEKGKHVFAEKWAMVSCRINFIRSSQWVSCAVKV